jgi:hypothetical protein
MKKIIVGLPSQSCCSIQSPTMGCNFFSNCHVGIDILGWESVRMHNINVYMAPLIK